MSVKNSLNSDAIDIIAQTFSCKREAIKNISMLKKGMTNHSFVFEYNDKKYIIRVPGEGTNHLINRTWEETVYRAIENFQICEKPVYINAQNGFKITKFINNVRTCDPNKEDDILLCMKKLKSFHQLHIKVNHEFDLFGTIEYYEQLRNRKSIYGDYEIVKKNIFSLENYIKDNVTEKCLAHIDSVPDNFLFDDSRQDALHVQLTDFEYSGMQDPCIDIAMFCIYSMYSKEQIDHLIDIYFDGNCEEATRLKIYCYIAACGLLWSNWCEYKSALGIEYGEYSLAQYSYAKKYYQIAKKRMSK